MPLELGSKKAGRSVIRGLQAAALWEERLSPQRKSENV